MAKSTESFSHSISGVYDMERNTITQYAKKETEEDKVYNLDNYLPMYNGREVTFSYRTTTELDSD